MNNLTKFITERKNFMIFSFLKILVMILGLITNIFIVRKLTVDNYGVFSIALMLVGLVTTFGFSWSSSSIIYYGSKEKAKTNSINKTFWSRNIIIGVSLLVITLLFVFYQNLINEYVGLEISLYILLWLYVSVAEDYLSQYFLAVKKQFLSSMLSLTAKLIYLILIMIFTFDVKTLIMLNILSHGSVILYILGINKKDIGKFEFDKDWFKEVLNFSLWQFFGFSGLYLINFGDTAVIKYFMTNEDVGIYNAAYKLFNAIAGFSYVITSYYASNVSQYFIKNNTQKIRDFFYKERFIILALSIIAHIVVMLFASPIINLLYGIRYVESIAIFNILMVGSIFRYINVFYILYLNTNNGYKVQQTINIFRAVLNVLLDLVFINLFGLIGPAIATTLAIVITTLFSVFYCENKIKKATES